MYRGMRYDAYRIAGYEKVVFFFIVQCKCEDPVQVFQETSAFFPVQCQYDFAVASCSEAVFAGKFPAYVLMVVYFAVYGQYLFPVRGEERLSAAGRVHDGQSFMSQTAPVRSSVSDSP